jgi:hypothetical protein
MKNWFYLQCFKDNEKLLEGVKTYLRVQVADFFENKRNSTACVREQTILTEQLPLVGEVVDFYC